jgi:predicted  nucleic acid-binding Zn-ribbon protein
MPTQEERLQTLEYGLKQFKTETIKAYGEVAIELTMVKGLTEDAVKRLASLRMQVEQVDQRFVNLNQQITGIQQEISDLYAGINQQITNVRQEVVDLHAGFDQQITNVRQEISNVQQEVVDLRAGFDQQITNVRQEVSGLKDLLLQVLARLPERSS